MIGFALLQDYVPHFSEDFTTGYESAQRLLYVLSSRARKHLHLISERNRSPNRHNPDGKTPTPNLLDYNYQYDLLHFENPV
jgi:superfamily I DNA/RNA helicase